MTKRLRFGVLLAMLVGLSVYQGPDVRADCQPPAGSAFQHETITVSSSSIGFTTGIIDNGSGQATYALVSIETNAVRFWSDGSAPTATVGHPVAAASMIEVCGYGNIKNFRMIRQSADATATVSYFR